MQIAGQETECPVPTLPVSEAYMGLKWNVAEGVFRAGSSPISVHTARGWKTMGGDMQCSSDSEGRRPRLQGMGFRLTFVGN